MIYLKTSFRLAKLSKSIESALQEYKNGLKGHSTPEELRDDMVNEIRRSFLRYFVNLFKSYDNYFISKLKRNLCHKNYRSG